MKSALLNCQAFVPPLMESQISPPYNLTREHLRLLQKWREYLYWLFNDGYCYNDFNNDIQKSVDDSMKVLLLAEIVREYDKFEMPSLEDLLDKISSFNASDICEMIQASTTSAILKKVFDPDAFVSSVGLPKRADLTILKKMPKSLRPFYSGKMPITIIADFHQMCLDVPVAEILNPNKSRQRHGNGVYYTPTPIVDYLTRRIMDKAFEEKDFDQITKARILDPSCGCGSFLIASYRYLLEKLAEHCKTQTDIPFTEKAVSILGSVIYGTDIDSNAVNWTKRLLLFTAWQSGLIHERYSSSNLKLSGFDLDNNIICQDFLEIDHNTFGSKAKAFDVVIGGPPFVRVQELLQQDPKTVDKYKQRFKSASNQFDLYMLFIEKSIELMEQDSLLGMSVSNSFLRSDSGNVLRELIADTCNVEEILEFEDSRVYQNAQVQIALISLEKSDVKTNTKHIHVKGKGGLRRRLKSLNNNVSIQKLDLNQARKSNWIFQSKADTEFSKRIEQAGKPIKELSIKINFGLATGADKVFMLKGPNSLDDNSRTIVTESRLLKGWFKFERDLIQPILRGRHIHGYEKPAPETMCICPYDHTGAVISEIVLSSKYPLTYEYLKRCRDVLKSKKLKKGVPWYSFRNSNISQYNNSPKIISSSIINGLSFSLENQNLLCSGSCIMISAEQSDVNPYVLLAILNSSLFLRWANIKMPSVADGWRSLRIGLIKDFAIPIKNDRNKNIFDDIAKRSEELMSNYFGIKETEQRLTDIDQMIRNIYNVI